MLDGNDRLWPTITVMGQKMEGELIKRVCWLIAPAILSVALAKSATAASPTQLNDRQMDVITAGQNDMTAVALATNPSPVAGQTISTQSLSVEPQVRAATVGVPLIAIAQGLFAPPQTPGSSSNPGTTTTSSSYSSPGTSGSTSSSASRS